MCVHVWCDCDMQIAAAHGLAQMCQSNHANQELVADEGGLEAVSEILQARHTDARTHTLRHTCTYTPTPTHTPTHMLCSVYQDSSI